MCGTINPSRKHLCKELIAEAKQLKNRGESLFRPHQNILFLAWKDRKVVYFLSSAHGPELGEPVQRNSKDNQGNHTKIDVPCPVDVHDYNKLMGGVDKNDQMARMRKVQKQLKWYMRPAIKLLLIAAYNAYILEGKIRQQRNNNGRIMKSLLDFKEDLICDMIGNVRTPPESLKRRRSVGAAEAHEERRLNNVGVHLPEKGQGRNHTCLVCQERIRRWNNANPNSDRPCPHVTRAPKTTIRCMDCKDYFCLTNERNCFADFHTKAEYWR